MRYDANLHTTLQPLTGHEALPATGHNTPVFDSLPRGAFGIIAGATGVMMLAYWLTFGAQAEAAFMVAISTVYVIMYVGTPYVMARIGEPMLRARHGGKPAPSLRDFVQGRMETWTGPLTGWAALIQVTLIPVGLMVATIGICLAVYAAR